MLRSMTGFGRGEYRYAGGKITAELKSVNHRFYELSARMPAHMLFLEDKIRSHINRDIKRGRVNLNLSIEGNQAADKLLAINKDLIKKYCRVLLELKKELKLKEGISLAQLMTLPEAVSFRPAEIDTEKIWLPVRLALDRALAGLTKTRQTEGAALEKDLLGRIKTIEGLTKSSNTHAPQVVADYKRAFLEKIKRISSSVKLESSRMETEVAIFAKNCDITEELTRITAHIKNLRGVIRSTPQAGRQIDFMAQELFREFNTAGSKASDTKISKWVIQAKEQIDKIREQVQNVE